MYRASSFRQVNTIGEYIEVNLQEGTFTLDLGVDVSDQFCAVHFALGTILYIRHAVRHSGGSLQLLSLSDTLILVAPLIGGSRPCLFTLMRMVYVYPALCIGHFLLTLACVRALIWHLNPPSSPTYRKACEISILCC